MKSLSIDRGDREGLGDAKRTAHENGMSCQAGLRRGATASAAMRVTAAEQGQSMAEAVGGRRCAQQCTVRATPGSDCIPFSGLWQQQASAGGRLPLTTQMRGLAARHLSCPQHLAAAEHCWLCFLHCNSRWAGGGQQHSKGLEALHAAKAEDAVPKTLHVPVPCTSTMYQACWYMQAPARLYKQKNDPSYHPQ